MMTEHPLTDDICLAIDDNPSVAYSCFDWKGSMRTAADWQLEQVIEWLDENLCNYNTGSTESCPGFFLPMSRLTVDLAKAMRPTNTQ